MDQLQMMSKNVSQNLLYLIKFDKQDLVCELKIDSISRLKFQIEKNNLNQFPCCCICLEDIDCILRTKTCQIIKTNCNHLYCKNDFYELLQRHGENQLNCVICRAKITCIFELDTYFESKYQPNTIPLRVIGFKRVFMDQFTKSFCKNCGQNGLRAVVKCCVCLQDDTAYCVTCITRDMIGFVQENYQKIVFYCGCSFRLQLFTLINQEPSQLQKIHALYLTDRDRYLESFVQQVHQYQVEKIISQQEIFCPICCLLTFEKEYERKNHIKLRPKDLYHIMYPETVLCSFCKKSYANQNNLNKHKCKKVQAPVIFFQN